MRVRTEQLGFHWADFKEIWHLSIFPQNLSGKVKFDENLTRITGTLHEELRYIFFVISRWIILRMRNVSDKSCRENQNTHFVFSNFFPQNRAVYEIMWKKYIWQYDTARMSFVWRLTMATDTHSEYVTLIAFQRQKWLRERASVLRYTNTAMSCLKQTTV